MNILLVEPDYRSKFPPLGLMRIASFHKERKDAVTFTRGKVQEYRNVQWNRIYISSLFTYELPRTVDTIQYYFLSVSNPSRDIFVGGIGATLLPNYIRERVSCNVIEGCLDKPNMLGLGEKPIATYIPDYALLDSVDWKYQPENAYFIRISQGCIRKCEFCAVPKLEPQFSYLQSVNDQLNAINKKYGKRQHLVILDNNILALSQKKENKEKLKLSISDIQNQGFSKGAMIQKRKRTVDFNQGIDARLITPEIATLLSSICLEPVRLAFDKSKIQKQYERAVELLAKEGFNQFTTYVMYNFDDNPENFYDRLKLNIELSKNLNIRISGFPMRYIPIEDVDRHHISSNWTWRYLRGVQCILKVTHGIVSPKQDFFEAAFGKSKEEFVKIITMPDNYIFFRSGKKHKEYPKKVKKWEKQYHQFSESEKKDFVLLLEKLHKSTKRREDLMDIESNKFKELLKHYYP
mgnify:CR=1 FL=1